ncbi:MAG TPA: hypothetical protein VH120_13685 [Gemmataceae bacterium]|nr:hypothetical protein [Gemmataceae bacterium]
MNLRIPRPPGLIALLPAVSCLILGCAAGKADVTGRVMHRGKPVTTGTVIVRGPDAIEMTGTIQPDGSYTVRGVSAGKAKFAVVSRDPAVVGARARIGKGRADGKEDEGKKDDSTKPPPPPPAAPGDAKWFPLPDKYESIDSSGLTTTLHGGANNYDLDLP